MHVSRVLAGAALALGLTFGAAVAAPIAGSISIDVGEVAGTSIAANSVLTLKNVQFGMPGDGDFMALIGSSIDDFTVTLTDGTPVIFNAAGGDYVGQVSQLFLFPGFANVVSIEGIFTPDPTFESSPGVFPFASLTENPETLVRLSFTLNGVGIGAGGAMEASGGTIPDVSVPEPLSLGMFGLGLAGLGLAMRRQTPT